MIRGTTPIITIKFPFDVSGITVFRMYFNQGKDNVVTKTEDDVTIYSDTNSVSTELSQEETYLFSPKKRIEVTARYKFSGGMVGAMKPKYLEIYDVDGDTDEVL